MAIDLEAGDEVGGNGPRRDAKILLRPLTILAGRRARRRAMPQALTNLRLMDRGYHSLLENYQVLASACPPYAEYERTVV